jgi:hypothetical protein
LLNGNVSPRRVAALHNTSISQLEKNYSAHITEHPDEVTRGVLLGEPPTAAANVVPISGR